MGPNIKFNGMKYHKNLLDIGFDEWRILKKLTVKDLRKIGICIKHAKKIIYPISKKRMKTDFFSGCLWCRQIETHHLLSKNFHRGFSIFYICVIEEKNCGNNIKINLKKI